MNTIKSIVAAAALALTLTGCSLAGGETKVPLPGPEVVESDPPTFDRERACPLGAPCAR